MSDIYIIGTLSREDVIEEAALYYLRLGYSVLMVVKQPDENKEKLIMQCFKNIYVLVPYKKQTSPKKDAKTLMQCNIVTRYTVSQLLELNVNDVAFIETI